MLNKIDLMGRLTRDPELRHTSNGTAVASFTLAVDRDFKSQDGERETDFIDCVAWRSTAEFASRYFSKGRMAVVSGRLQIRPWEDRDGNKRRSAEVVVDNMYFGDSKKDGDSGGGGYQQGGYGNGYGGGYSGGYGSDRSGSGRSGSAPSGYGSPPASGGYPSSDYGQGFSEIEEDDGELPF